MPAAIEMIDDILRRFPGKPGFPPVPEYPLKWTTGERFSENHYEKDIHKRYKEALRCSSRGLKDPDAWQELTGDTPQVQSANPIRILVPAYIEPGIESTLQTIRNINRPPSVPLEITVIADGNEEITTQATEREMKRSRTNGDNSSLSLLRIPRSGKTGGIKQAIETYEMLNPAKNEDLPWIICDADCRFDPDSIPLVWAGLRLFPKIPIVSGTSIQVHNGSLLHHLTFPRPDTAFRRVSGPLFGIRSEAALTIPDGQKWEDYFLMVWMETMGYDYICIQEAFAYQLPPTSLQEYLAAGKRYAQGLKQIEEIFATSEGYPPILPEFTSKYKPFLDSLILFARKIRPKPSDTTQSNYNGESVGWTPNMTTKEKAEII